MKHLFVCLFVLSFCACTDSETVPETLESSTDSVPQQDTEAQESGEPIAISFPCNKLSDRLVAKSLGWKKSSPGVSSSMRNGTLNTCLFTGTSNEGSLSAVISYSDPITVENKYIERSFENALARSNEKMTVKTVPTTLGDEAIYSYGEQGPNKVFKLQWRRGNSVEYSISYRANEPYDAEIILERLNKLARQL